MDVIKGVNILISCKESEKPILWSSLEKEINKGFMELRLQGRGWGTLLRASPGPINRWEVGGPRDNLLLDIYCIYLYDL
jgi:hypothetical protein